MAFIANLFKPRPCSNCLVPTKRRHLVDETWRGRHRGAKQRLKLCSDCLAKLLPSYFESFGGRALILEPVAKSNAYYAFTMDDSDIKYVAANGEHDRDSRERTKKALARMLGSASGECSRCRASGVRFVWIPAGDFDGKWWNLDIEELEERSTQSIALCGACAGVAVANGLGSFDIQYDEINPPYDDTVLMFSGEA